MKIVFTGGGTGGHVYPLIAIAREINRLSPQKKIKLYYVGPKHELNLILLSQEGFIVKTITAGKIRRYFSFQNIIDVLFKIPFGILQSLFMMLLINPDLVFSKGGSGSFVVVFAANIFNIPIFLHESDVAPGLSNQRASNWAKKIFISFPKTEYFDPKKTILTGNPVRSEILDGSKSRAGELFDLSFSKPIFLISGGSQGAEAINDFVLTSLNKLLKVYEVIHVAGRANIGEVKKEAQVIIERNLEKYYHPVAFLNEEELKHVYAASDLVASRSGSGSIFEIAACGKPSILVPLPSSAGDHQSKNAYAYAETGACMVMEQENLTPNFFMENVQLLLFHSDKTEQMKQSALAFAKPLAARAIAREILEFLMLD